MSLRHIHQCCGQPWASRSGGPSPASATWRPIPLALTVRWRTPGTGGRSSSLTSTDLDGVCPSVSAGSPSAQTHRPRRWFGLTPARRRRSPTDGGAETSVCPERLALPPGVRRCGGGALTTPSNPGAHMKRAATTTPLPYEGTQHQTLSAYIQARFDEFSRSQKDVAQYIVDHLDEAAFQTAEELARRANTSSSTVVRFSQALGFEGFPELQGAAREEYRRAHATPVAAGTPAAPLFSLDQSEFETALAADHVNVEETARKVSRSDVEAAIDAIATAPRVLIIGTDQMAFFASYLRHLLALLDLRADIVASPSQGPPGKLARIAADTLVVGLSAGRPHPLVVRAMKLARHRKAKTVAITDATLSEVAKLAQVRLYYSSNSPAYVRSHTALLSMIQALAYGVYSRDAEQYADRIKAFRLK